MAFKIKNFYGSPLYSSSPDRPFTAGDTERKEKKLDKTYINFSIVENNNEIKIFFDNKTFNLIGWQTKDIYQNVTVTYLSSIQLNQQVDKKLFKLPTQN